MLETLPTHDVVADDLEPLEHRFVALLQGFDFSGYTGEPAGAVFQGFVYAYLRADAPHLHLDISKVGAGSKRLQRVGDVDGWEGERLILSAEVKGYDLDAPRVGDCAAFLNQMARRKAMAIVVARSFTADARVDLEAQGARTLDLEELIRLVSLWDPLKQRAAVNSFSYYVHHIQQNSRLGGRLRRFLTTGAPSLPE